ncbi:MAG: class I adenylate-forming enzyme family protein [Acidimicrobiia bacterium]
MSHGFVSADRHAWWEIICERADLTPDRRMLEDDRDRTITYGEFRDLAERVAAGLWDMGVRPGQVVSWQLPTTIEAPLLMAALSRLGVSQNPIIAILRRAEVSLILDQLQSQWFVIPGVWRGFDYNALAAEVTDGRECTVVVCDADGLGPGEWALPQGDPSVLPPYVTATADSPVRWYFYSSGTTGKPKGVIHTEHSVVMASRYLPAIVGMNADDMLPMAYPFTHIGGPTLFTGHILVGARMMMIEAFDPVRSSHVMGAHGATLLGSAVPFFQAYLAAQQAHGSEPIFPNLRWGLAGGAPLPPEINRRFREEMHCGGILNAWGLTEFPCCTTVAPDDPAWVHATTVGRAVQDVEVHAIAPDGTVLPPGGEGELCLRGPQGFQGYVDSSLDAAAFTADGFVRTGDVGIVDAEGYIRLTGRIKDIIIRNAENISALEVEDVLCQHPAIGSVAVIGLPDEMKGERCCAVIVLADGAGKPTLTDIAAHCRAAGLANQKIPEQLEFIDALPINSMGKVLKHELRAQFGSAV